MIVGADVVDELRRRAEAGESVTQVFLWLREELGAEANFFKFASILFMAFKIPVEVVRRAEEWRGWGGNGSLSDQEVEQIFSPLIPRSGAIGE